MAEIGAQAGASGVIGAEGTAWRQQRRLWTDALGPGRVRDFYPTLRTVVERLRTRLTDAAQRGEPIDIVSDFKRFTADTTTFLALGYDLNSLRQADDVVQRHIYRSFEIDREGSGEQVSERLAIAMAPDGLKVRLRARG